MALPVPPAWFERHFNSDYPLLYAARTEEDAQREVDGLLERLEIGPNARILDLCCGSGRHLLALVRRGRRPMGLDLSADLLAEARSLLRENAPAVPLLVRADMRSLPLADASLDVVLSFFTSFGYFDAERDHRRALAEIARVLVPGGRVSLDLMNPDATVKSLVPTTTREERGHRIVEHRRWDPVRRRVEKSIELTELRSGETREYFESVRVFDEDEIVALARAAGLRILEVWGDFDGSSRTERSPRMIVAGERES